jgi:hypothetical protein
MVSKHLASSKRSWILTIGRRLWTGIRDKTGRRRCPADGDDCNDSEPDPNHHPGIHHEPSAAGGNGGNGRYGTFTGSATVYIGGNGGNGTGSGLSLSNGASTTLANTLIAGNTLTAGTGGSGVPAIGATTPSGSPGPATAPDVSGTVTTADHDLIGDGTGATITTSTGNKVGTSSSPINPLLGPLQNNGGTTWTLALLVGSPAINAGNNARIPVGVTTDQRGQGFARIKGGTVDIGAYEF